jgi:hypothetical protein
MVEVNEKSNQTLAAMQDVCKDKRLLENYYVVTTNN